MKTLKINTILILLFSFIITHLYAQPDFKPGYVIQNNKDTLFGKIDNRGNMMMSSMCRFKPNNSDSILIFSPGEIIEYRFFEGKCYVTKNLESGKPVFLEYLINGKLNIYYYRDDQGEEYYLLDKEDMPLKVIPFKEKYMFNDDGKRVLYQSKKHVGLLRVYTKDAGDLYLESNRITEPDHNNLIKYAEKYHNIVCKDERCIIYEKKVPFIKVSFELFYGQTFFNKKLDTDNTIRSSEIGLYIYSWLPRMNEKFYFKTGFQRCKIDYEGDKFIHYVLPIQIQYQYPHFMIKPKIFYGFNNYFIDKDFSHWTIATGGGLDLKFSKRMSLTSNFTAEFVPVAFKIAEGLTPSNSESITFLSYSIYLGLKIEL